VKNHSKTHFKEECSPTGYSRIGSKREVTFDQTGWPKKLIWTHPITGWKITLDRQADEN
jgi:hypothetical protein